MPSLDHITPISLSIFTVNQLALFWTEKFKPAQVNSSDRSGLNMHMLPRILTAKSSISGSHPIWREYELSISTCEGQISDIHRTLCRLLFHLERPDLN